MGHTIWVEAQDGRSNHEDNGLLCKLEEPLVGLADALRVPRLTSFYDYSELEVAYAEFLPDDAGSLPAERQWFDPTHALPTVRAIRAHLIDHPDILDAWFQNDRTRLWQQLMEELQHVESELTRLGTTGTRFCLLVVP